MPAMKDVSYVDSAQGLGTAVAAVRRAPVVGFDTEFVGEATYQPQLCLLQVSTPAGIWIIDPLTGIVLDDFWAAITEPGREVIALAARQEVLFCLRYAGRPPAALFDPQIAAGLVGLGYPLSHTNLVRRLLDVQVGGGEAFTDWRKRPLTPRQLEYAASDVRHLLPARERLLERARALKRTEWVSDECRLSVQRIIESEQEERWWRVSGASGLKPRDLGVLRELWRWRDATARAEDLPPRRVLSDDLLVEIAKRGPRTVPDLLALRGLERSSVRRAAPDIVRAVAKGLHLPDDQLPTSRRHDDPPQVGVLAHLVSTVANGLAAQHEVDPALLATTADLQELVRWHLRPNQHDRPVILDGWRGDILGRPLLDLLRGESCIRVANVNSPNPLRVEPYRRA